MKVGDNIAGYDIVRKMKSGGMATLYLGRRSREGGFEKQVAIKVVHEHLTESDEFTRMFLDEARISASIEHPNVVHVHDLGTTEAGRNFLVMEYVPGISLSQLMRVFRKQRKGPTPAMATWIAMQIAAGLHAAHELTTDDGTWLGVVHRDVSPKNVIVADKGYVKLIDFGIAKAADRIHKTKASQLKGTFRYMSPEQAAGTVLDRRTDIYALGIMLWELLTQRKLFHAANDIALLEAVRNPQVVPPSTIAPDIPPDLDAIIMKALARDPAQRPPTMATFRAELSKAVPDALALTQDDVAKFIEDVAKSQAEEEPSVHSAMGAPKRGDATTERFRRAAPVSAPPVWGALDRDDEEDEATNIRLEDDDLLPGSASAAAKPVPPAPKLIAQEHAETNVALPPKPDALQTERANSASKLPVEFDMVEAADIEVDLPPSPSTSTSTSPAHPYRQELPAGPSVLVEDKFFERLPFAFVAPLLGKAWALLLFSALVPACAAVLLTLDVGLVLRVSFAVPMFLFSIGLLTEIFSRLAQEGADNDVGVPSPTLGDTELQTVLGAGMATLFIVALLFVFPAYLFIAQYIGVVTFTVLSFLPYVYWPMAFTVQGITGDIVAGLDVVLVFRTMLRAPVKYFVVVALGFGLTVALSIAVGVVSGMLLATVGPSRFLVFGLTFVFFGTVTYLQGVMGYAMGRLVATEDKLAEALVRR
ncbi:MAG: serine/threonine protein kinase [Polyangiales bacterium]